METSVDPTVEAYWQAFVRLGRSGPDTTVREYQAWPFGCTPRMADYLGGLMVQEIKTATPSLLCSYEAGVQPYPVEGGYNVILDGCGKPLCILQTTRITVVPFDEVDEEQAYLEGEGDQTLRYWREVHWRYFEEECRRLGKKPDLKMPIVCERFTLVFK